MSSLFGSAPKAPDPAQVAAADEAAKLKSAQQQASLNAVDQYNPYGSTSYLRDANGDPYGQISNLSPEMQWLLTGQLATAGGLTGIGGQLMNTLPMGGIQGPSPNEVGNQAFAAQQAWLQPQFDRQTSNLQTTLTDRGVPVGSEAWNNAMQPVLQGQNQAWTSAANQAQVAGAQEQNTLWNQAFQAYDNPYNLLAQVLGENPTSNVLGRAPGAINTSPTTIAPTDVGGIYNQAYQNQLAASKQNSDALGSTLTGGASLLGGIAKVAPMFAMSDKNLKEDRHPASGENILDHISDLPIDHYRYKDGAQMAFSLPEHRTGPMAQDWRDHFGGDGHTIDLGDMAGKMLAAIQALDARTSHLSRR